MCVLVDHVWMCLCVNVSVCVLSLWFYVHNQSKLQSTLTVGPHARMEMETCKRNTYVRECCWCVNIYCKNVQLTCSRGFVCSCDGRLVDGLNSLA